MFCLIGQFGGWQCAVGFMLHARIQLYFALLRITSRCPSSIWDLIVASIPFRVCVLVVVAQKTRCIHDSHQNSMHSAQWEFFKIPSILLSATECLKNQHKIFIINNHKIILIIIMINRYTYIHVQFEYTFATILPKSSPRSHAKRKVDDADVHPTKN